MASIGNWDCPNNTICLKRCRSVLVAVPMPSPTLTVKLDVPGAVGVPEITPAEPLNESPVGRDATVIDQV